MASKWRFGELHATTRQPVFLPHETQHAVYPGIRVYHGEQQSPYDDGNLLLTSHRVVWVEAAQGNSTPRIIYCSLENVTATKFIPPAFIMNSSPKVALYGTPDQPPSSSSSSSLSPESSRTFPFPHSPLDHVRLSFRLGGSQQNGPKEFISKLEGLVKAKSWIQAPTTPQKQEKYDDFSISLTRAGVRGIHEQRENEIRKGEQSIQQAFTGDLGDLMEKTKDLVQLAEKYTTKISKKTTSSESSDTAEFESYIMSLGIDLPVTKAVFGSGDRYHKELAREVAGFLLKPIEAARGMLLLTDAYCMINRARGTELISPDDLRNACDQLEGLGLPLRLAALSNGVLVVQLASHSEQDYVKETVECVSKHACLGASALAHEKGWSLTLAQQHLLKAEEAGLLCRDDTVECLVFYPNKISKM